MPDRFPSSSKRSANYQQAICWPGSKLLFSVQITEAIFILKLKKLTQVTAELALPLHIDPDSRVCVIKFQLLLD